MFTWCVTTTSVPRSRQASSSARALGGLRASVPRPPKKELKAATSRTGAKRGQLGGVERAAPLRAPHRAHRHLLAAQPLADAPRLRAPELVQIALRAAVAESERRAGRRCLARWHGGTARWRLRARPPRPPVRLGGRPRWRAQGQQHRQAMRSGDGSAVDGFMPASFAVDRRLLVPAAAPMWPWSWSGMQSASATWIIAAMPACVGGQRHPRRGRRCPPRGRRQMR